MAYVRTTEVQEARNGFIDTFGTRRFTRVFRVEFDAREQGPRLAIYYTPVSRYDPYQEANGIYDFRAVAMSITAAPEDPENCFNWLCTVEYSTEIWNRIAANIHSGGINHAGTPPSDGAQSGDTSPINPILRPAKVRWGIAVNNMVQDQDYRYIAGVLTPRAWTNSAGDRADPAREVEVYDQTLTIERNELSFVASVMRQYFGKLNSDIFMGCSPRQVKCVGITAESEHENGFDFWQVRYEFIVRHWKADPAIDYWDSWWLDQGTHEVVGGARRHIMLHGTEVTSPVPLKSTGEMLPDADVTAGNYHYQRNVPYDIIAFQPLQLP